MPAKTLYDQLCVRPDDDAEALQSAFRNAAKASHPDLNPGDPDAARRFRQIVTAYAILRDAGQRRAYDLLLVLDRARRRAMLTRAIVSGAVAGGTLTFGVLLCGYALFAQVSKTSVEAAMVVEAAARKPADTIAVQTIGVEMANRDHPSERLREVPDNGIVPRMSGGSSPAIADGRPAEIHVVEPVAPTDTSQRDEPSGKSVRVKLADVPIAPSAVAQEAKTNEPSIIANGGPAVARTGSNSEVAKAVGALDVRVDRGDSKKGADDQTKNNESNPLDQNRGRSVQPHFLSSEKDASLAKTRSSNLAIFDEKHYMRRTGKLRVHATQPASDRTSVREAALESRDLSQVALESRTTSACAASCSKRPPLLFGVGF